MSNFDELNQQAITNGFDTYKDPIFRLSSFNKRSIAKERKVLRQLLPTLSFWTLECSKILLVKAD
jgi:hypothetical protein